MDWRIASYRPIDGEFSPHGLEELLRAQGAHLCYPRCHDGELQFSLEEGCRWQRSSFGILEPQGDAIALDSIDLLLLPAVAVDTRGYRLGFGGGYYDRLLERAPMLRFRSCALCFLEQRCAALPNEHHDARLAACLDANGLHLFEQAANVSSAASFPSTTLGAELPQAQSQEPEVP